MATAENASQRPGRGSGEHLARQPHTTPDHLHRMLPLGRLSQGRKKIRWKSLPRSRAWALPGSPDPTGFSQYFQTTPTPSKISHPGTPSFMPYPRTRSWAREQTTRSPGAWARAGKRSSTPECKPRAPPRPASAHFEQDLAKFPRGSARVELDAGSYRRLLVPDSGRGSAPEVEGRSPPSSRPVLHPREAAQPERQRGAHPPGHHDALCLPSFSLRRDRERDDREKESEQAATGSVFFPQGGCPGWVAGGAGPDPGASVHQAQQPAPWPRKLGHLVALSPQVCLPRVLSAGDLSAAVAELQSNRPPMPDKLIVPRPGDAPPWSQAGG